MAARITAATVCCGPSSETVHAAEDVGEICRASSNRVRLWTDLDGVQARRLVTTFDTAVSQWCEAWRVDQDRLGDWTADAYVMRDEAAFRNAGLIPDGLPKFEFGYALGNRLFVRAQPSEYYTRHLLLHEGVHAFMFRIFDDLGPTWFMEGTAEWLSTHRGAAGGTVVGVLPHDRNAFPYWGRYRQLDEDRAAGRLPRIETVMRFPGTLRGDVRSYAGSWALVRMLMADDRWATSVREAANWNEPSAGAFNRRFYRTHASQWPAIVGQWRVWLDELEYGFTAAQWACRLSTDDPPMQTGAPPLRAMVRSNVGWQSTGRRFYRGQTVRLRATGRAVVAKEGGAWISTPRGVSLRYIGRRPLGRLMYAVVPAGSEAGDHLSPLDVRDGGVETSVRFDQPGWLVMKIVDAAGEREENEGGYEVMVAG